MLKQNPSSGGRRSSDGNCEVAQTYCSSYGWAPRTGRNLVAVSVKVFCACFGLKIERSTKEEPAKNFKSPSSTFSGSSHGGSQGSRMRSSSRGLYATGSNPSQKQPGNKKFTLQEISKATENFCSSLKIGEGGFGTVYKGNLDDGTVVAVKRAKMGVRDNCRNMEFQTEIKTLARVEHFNLVRFIGYVEQDGEKVVVVEYVPNGTLREHLDCLQGKPLDFAARLDIAIDIAHAVTYLHMYADHPIIHRDIKSSNVLLTETLRAKVTDFGFARFGMNESEASYITTQVKGTAGYLDPEYLKTYQLTEKSDVFSFGVLLVELISGRRPIEPKRDRKETITAKWVIKNFSEGNAKETLDPNLPASPSTNFALEKILELALQCMAPTRQNRPSMRRCAEILWRIRKYYRELFNSEPPSVPSQWRNASSNGRMEPHHLYSKSKNEASKSCSVQRSAKQVYCKQN
ncbi:hypothetical protein KFK09_020262 [Dendrobium nobile]|uniref:non-specific serine/threonine protein kinase n=1 Tax=Dendrobium nobile TaxID=94219 RepID=A0A8T3AST7_DENNO|nr:hypothetical protein KFK09_020262 [Dendrobium nobile]